MRPFVVLIGFFAIISSMNAAKSSLINTNKNRIPLCSCHCNLNQDRMVCDKALKALETKLDMLIALVSKTSSPTPQPTKPPAANKTRNPTPRPTTPQAVPVSSCKEQYEKDNSSKSQVYTLKFGSQKVPVYCHMGDFGCGDGGWTLAIKIDGSKPSFRFNSHLWIDRKTFNLTGGKTGFDHQETKLPTYWNTPFSKLCLGMKIGHQIKFITINKNANSLYSLIADGLYRATLLGRSKWKSMFGSRASLQPNCNKEGFNAVCTYSNGPARARIGILGNGENDCVTCDSRIGFGMGGLPTNFNSCGNEASSEGDNGAQHLQAMGYILVQ